MKERFVDRASAGRRAFLTAIGSVVSLAITGCTTIGKGHQTPEDEAEVTPGEDLMQEHGVLERILLIYDEVARRIEHRERFDPVPTTEAAQIVRSFVEDYHERTEEQFVFPRLQAAGKQTELVAVLLQQHRRGRELTDAILESARSGKAEQLAALLRSFVRMYRPHAAREDTVLFPAFRQLVGGKAYRDLGEQFEEREHQMFGEDGFEDAVAAVARIEQSLAIADLAKFTP